MNFFIFTGNLTRDPEIKYTKNGTGLCAFTVAVPRPFDRTQTDFFDVIAFGKTGELAKRYLAKGKKAAIAGSVQIDTWEDQGGSRRKSIKVVADRIEFLSPADKPPQEPGAWDSLGEEVVPF